MSTLLRTLFLLTLPLITHQQTPVKPGTNTDIVPFGSLPLCAQSCGPLFDVAYGCVPPEKPSVDIDCFCTNKMVSAVGEPGPGNTCANVCAAAADVTAIQTWFNSLCGSKEAQPTDINGGSPENTDAGSTETGDSGTENLDNESEDSGADRIPKKQTWIESHYQYVIMIVIIVVAIVGGWVTAAYFRRRYLRKRELNYEMRPPTAPWVTGHTGPTGPYGGGGFGESVKGKGEVMVTAPMTAAQVIKEKKKWIIGERK